MVLVASMYIQQAVNLYLQTIKSYKDAADAKGVRRAVYVGGGQVSLGGQMYDIEFANEVHVSPNQVVYVALNQQGTKAVILG